MEVGREKEVGASAYVQERAVVAIGHAAADEVLQLLDAVVSDHAVGMHVDAKGVVAL